MGERERQTVRSQWLRAFVTFPEDLSLVASTYVRQLTISCNSSSTESDTLWHEWVHINTRTNFKDGSYKKKTNEQLPANQNEIQIMEYFRAYIK